MKLKKENIILYTLLILAIGFAIYNRSQKQQLSNSLKETQEKNVKLVNRLDSKNKIEKIDSILMNGKYESALRAYQKELNSPIDDADKAYLKFRLALSQQFIDLSKRTQKKDSLVDSLKVAETDVDEALTTGSIRKIDSLTFALDKAKVQLSSIKKQLHKKSYGAYITFLNPKEHQLHYIGQVNQGKANGFGIALFDTGSRYEGEWKDNLRNGKGSFYWPDGEYYQGEYLNDLRNGKGTYFWPNGEKYIGNWKNDQRDGEGVFYDKDDKIITKGVWKKDKLVDEHKEKRK